MSDLVEAYAAQGYAVLPVLDPEAVLRLRHDITEHIDSVMEALHLPFSVNEPEADFAGRLEATARKDQSLANLPRVAICTYAHRRPHFQSLIAEGAIALAASARVGRSVGDPVIRLRAIISTRIRHRHGWHSDVSQIGYRTQSRIRTAA